MNMPNEIGAIDAGRLADLVILDVDPLATVDNLARIQMVIKDGVLFDPDALARAAR